MATNFPLDIDVFVNPTPTDQVSVISHSSQHTDANDSINAIERFLKLGTVIGSPTVVGPLVGPTSGNIPLAASAKACLVTATSGVTSQSVSLSIVDTGPKVVTISGNTCTLTYDDTTNPDRVLYNISGGTRTLSVLSYDGLVTLPGVSAPGLAGFKTFTGTFTGTTVTINDADILVGNVLHYNYTGTPIGNIKREINVNGTITGTSTATETGFTYTVIMFAGQTQSLPQPIGPGSTVYTEFISSIAAVTTTTITHNLGITQADLEDGKYTVMFSYRSSQAPGRGVYGEYVDTAVSDHKMTSNIWSAADPSGTTPYAEHTRQSNTMKFRTGTAYTFTNVRVFIKQNR